MLDKITLKAHLLFIELGVHVTISEAAVRPGVIWKLRLREFIGSSRTIGINVLMGGGPRGLLGLFHHIETEQK